METMLMRLHGSCGSLPKSWVSTLVLDLVHGRLSCMAYLLLDLKRVHSGSELTQNLIGLLVELQLGGDQIGQVAQGLGGIKDLNEQGAVNTGVTSKTNCDSKNIRSSSR